MATRGSTKSDAKVPKATRATAPARAKKSSAGPQVKLIDPARLPLFTLLSFVLVAFTIEFDNEAERRGKSGGRSVAHVDGDVHQLHEARAGGWDSPQRAVRSRAHADESGGDAALGLRDARA